jgi:hypothetical protein
MVVHPRARNELCDGDAIVAARLKEEHEAKEQLSQLEKMDVGSQRFLGGGVRQGELCCRAVASMLHRARDLLKQATA